MLEEVAMKELHINYSNQTTNNIDTNWLWDYGKQALKGIGVMGLGVLGYVGLRGYWRTGGAADQAKPESSDLVAAQDVATQVGDQGLAGVSSSSGVGKDVWDTASQSVQYRRKRGVVPMGEFQVNTYTTYFQNEPAIAALPNGEFVITWQSFISQDGDGSGVYAQHFAGNGSRIGNEFQVNTYTTSEQNYPAIASLPNGEFVIAWQSYGQDGSGFGVYAEHFAGNGSRIGNEFQVNTYISGAQSTPAIANLPNADFIITWQSYGQDGDGWGIYAQHFAANGNRVGNEFQVNSYTTNDQFDSAIAGLPNGDFVITWTSTGQDGDGSGVYAQHFAANGNRLGNEFQVNTYTINNQFASAIAGLPNGDFVITWTSTGQDGDGSGVYAQHFAGNGSRIGNEFKVNTYTNSEQSAPAIASLPNGEFVITWQSDGQDEGGYGVYAQRFDINAISYFVGSEFQVNVYTTSSQKSQKIASLPNGDFVITWTSGVQDGSSDGVYARLFTMIHTPPQLNHNSLTIDQGQTSILTSTQLLALTDSVAINSLTFISTDITFGWFNYVSAPNQPIFNFTQAAVNKGQIQFTQDDSYNVPSYQIAVFDGISVTLPQSAMVDFDQKPLWINNDLIPIANHGQAQLSSAKLLAIDDRNNTQVFFEVGNVTHGVFALSSVLNPFSYPLSSFTQQQVNASQINFVHDGSNLAPSCDVRANDGRLYTAYQPCQFTFTPNNPPQLSRNALTLMQGDQKIVDGASLAATDPDAITTDELGQLMFNLTAIEHGQFELSTQPTVAVTSVLQSQVFAGQLLFKHDGSNQAPSYNVIVTDGYAVTDSQPANISFSLAAASANVNRDNTNVVTGAVIGATGAALLLTGVGIFGAYRYRRSKQLEEQRSNYPLANALYHELNIAGTDDFQSEKGINFINAVDSLNNELIRAGVDTKQMVAEEINELAHKLAMATKAQLGERINLLDIQDYAQGIVATAMTLSGKNKAKDDTLVEMDGDKDKIFTAAIKQYMQKKNISLEEMSPSEIEVLAKDLLEDLSSSSRAARLAV